MDGGLLENVETFVRSHKEWALPIVFVVAGMESIVGLSLLVPSTAIFIAIAAAGGFAEQNLALVCLSAGIGASAGDWVSYGLGYFFERPARRVWPLSKKPELLDKAHVFFERWGVLGIFICRFIGPARSLVMLVAGILRMHLFTFFAASFASALLWAAAVIVPASYGAEWLWQL